MHKARGIWRRGAASFVLLRILALCLLPASLLFLWSGLVRASMSPATLPPPVVLNADDSLRPALFLRQPDGALIPLWRPPAIGHISRVRQEGARVQFTWTPTGASTAPCALRVSVNLRTRDVITSPSPTCDLSPPSLPITSSQPLRGRIGGWAIGENVLAPPPYIRVYHDPRNTCRNASPGQVDVIPFEEYVARVVPAEMPALWPMEALKAQAIAVRTYAWYHILQARPDWDVSDWSNFQVMCDRRHPRSDAAVQATAGQALTFAGRPILAFYSAQNGHPTLDDPWGLPYIAPVPDPVSLGQTRWGHGLGLSQYGAKAWAERGWNAYQILAHYYPRTSLSLPPAAEEAVGTLLPPELEDMTLGRGYPLYVFLASPRPLEAITVTARVSDTVMTVLTRTGAISSFLGVWAPPATLTSSTPIALMATAVDVSGTVSILGQAQVWRDLRPLTVTLSAVTETVNPRVPLTMNRRTPVDVSVALGISDGWLWEERAFSVNPAGVGRVITDARALDGWAWEHPRQAPPAVLYGPYTDALEPGRAYRAWFRLRVDDVSSPDVVVFLDVVDDEGQTLLGMRALRGIEFPAANTYREYPVDFYLPSRADGRPHRVEFRVHATGSVTLAVDRVLVTTYPRPWQEGTRWRLPLYDGLHRLVAKATTRSGVVAADVPLSVTLNMPEHPVGFVPPVMRGWISRPITLTWQVTTAVSPPRADTFAYRYAREGAGWSPWHPLRPREISTRAARLDLPARVLPDGRAVRVQVRGEDAFTYPGTSAVITVAVDLHPPELTAAVSSSPNARGWYTAPVTVTAVAQDRGAGIQRLTVAERSAALPWQEITLHEPAPILTHTLVLTRDGAYTLSFTAVDGLGREAQRQITIPLDTTPPRAFILAPVRVERTRVNVLWGTKADDVVAYDVDVQVNGGTWARWLDATVETSAVYTGTPGARVAFRVRAHDRAGWTGPWSSPFHVVFPRLLFLPHLAR